MSISGSFPSVISDSVSLFSGGGGEAAGGGGLRGVLRHRQKRGKASGSPRKSWLLLTMEAVLLFVNYIKLPFVA